MAAASEPALNMAVPAIRRGGRRYRRTIMSMKNYTGLLLHRDSTIAYLIVGGGLLLVLAYAFLFPSIFPGFAG
jgi:hypothetical protein